DHPDPAKHCLQWEIWDVDWAHEDGTSKPRPALVLSSTAFNATGRGAWIAKFTTSCQDVPHLLEFNRTAPSFTATRPRDTCHPAPPTIPTGGSQTEARPCGSNPSNRAACSRPRSSPSPPPLRLISPPSARRPMSKPQKPSPATSSAPTTASTPTAGSPSPAPA